MILHIITSLIAIYLISFSFSIKANHILGSILTKTIPFLSGLFLIFYEFIYWITRCNIIN
jgi:hypothetical protein